MAKNVLFIIVLVVAIFVRFFKLGALPDGLTWDEAAIGYNAYGLITNHRDEWLKRTPIVFQSFGDYKSPLLVYLTTFPVFVFGLTPFAIRLPNALAGVGLVVVSYLLAKEVFKRERAAFVVMALTACSPWAIHYSRMGFESMVACFLVVSGIAAWVIGITKFSQKKRRQGFWLWLAGDALMAMSLYAYHSSKVVVPLVLVVLGIVYWQDFVREKKALMVGGALFVLLLLPLGYATIFGKANARATSTTIISNPQPIAQFFNNFVQHLSPAFLVQGKDITYRHSTLREGVFYPVELGLALAGFLIVLSRQDYRKFWWISALFFIGIMPAAFGLDVPHSNRALLAFFWLEMLSGVVMLFFSQYVLSKKTILLFVGISSVTVGVSLAGYVRSYQSTYTSSLALRELGYGYQELISFIRPEEAHVDRIYFSNTYGQAYIYLLLFKQLTPMEYQHGGLANYTITANPWEEAKGKSGVLVIGTDEQIPDDTRVIKEITYPDGKIAFQVARL